MKFSIYLNRRVFIMRLDLEYPNELWRCLSCFDTCIIFYAISIRREERNRAFIFARVGLFTYGLIPIKYIFVFPSLLYVQTAA